ncbi:hypothetical protein LCGC14_2949550 [marine sediment metagenome]|uniref:SAP domain-containing protein n=1 Tax=marine sediment metagenome TaxID=412755 RepID=A0A0F9A6W2_9ZZZZ
MTVMTKPNKRDVKKSTPVAVGPVPDVVRARSAIEICEISNLSYNDLRSRAKKLGLKANGSKAALIERVLSI